MTSQIETNCFSCGKSLQGILLPVGRRDTCPHCTADVHVCKNCKFYDTTSYNECRESQAERVLDKDKSNFCDYFSLGNASTASSGPSKDDVLNQLDDLFKK